MKNSWTSFLTIVIMTFLCVACSESNGPKGNYYPDNRTTDEVVDDVLSAEENNGWIYLHDVDLHKEVDGEWVNVGRHSLYAISSDHESDCNIWVEFDGPTGRFPAESTDRAGYQFRAMYMGEYYYF